MHLGLGNSLVMQPRRGGGPVDPLAGLALRLQSSTNTIVNSIQTAYSYGDYPLGGNYELNGSVYVNSMSGYYLERIDGYFELKNEGGTTLGVGDTAADFPWQAGTFSNVFTSFIENTMGIYGILGLYQDLLCTSPVTTPGQSIAAWRDELSNSGLVAVQPNVIKRPVMEYVNGRPCPVFDGVDDYMKVTTAWDLESVLMTTRYSSRRFPGGGFPYHKSHSVADNGVDNGTWWSETPGNSLGFGSNGIWRGARVENFPTAVQNFNNLYSIKSAPMEYEVWQQGFYEGSYAADFNVGNDLYIGCNAGLDPAFCFKGWINSLLIGDDTFDRASLEALALELLPL